MSKFLIGIVCLIASSNVLLAQELLQGGDVIKVTVFGHADLSVRTTVSDDGAVTLPLLNKVSVAGKSTTKVEQIVRWLLSSKNFVRNPSVTVEVEKSSITELDAVTLLGEVRHPGRFPITSVEDGAQTLVGLLALAGGIAEQASDELILTRKQDSQIQNIRVDLISLLQLGDLTQNHQLQRGDVVMVPRSSEVFVYGEVRHPGRFRLDRDMTVVQALALSGGLTNKGTEKGLTVRRSNSSSTTVHKVGLDDKLLNDDVLYVREGLF